MTRRTRRFFRRLAWWLHPGHSPEPSAAVRFDTFEEYLRAELTRALDEKLKANSCPTCDLLYVESDAGTVFCMLCGYHPPPPEPPPALDAQVVAAVVPVPLGIVTDGDERMTACPDPECDICREAIARGLLAPPPTEETPA